MKIYISVVCLVIIVAISLVPNSVRATDDYIISPGDVLQVSVWGSPDFSVETPVRPDGKMTMPAVGDVDVAGLTTVQLKERLVKAIKNFVKKPIVTITVTEITNNKVYISGGGISTGVVTLSGNMTLFRLLCQLEGLRDADLITAYLLRDGKKLIKNFYPLFMNSDLSKDVVLKANDVIHIASNEKNKVYVVGSVKEPKVITYHYGMRVLDVILGAGGFNEYAKQSKIVILREDGKQYFVNIEKLLSGEDSKQNVPLIPGDYVIVKESMF